MMVREDEKTLQVPSVQALQAVASTVMIIDDQLVLNGYLELEQVAERMRTYSFDDSCGRHDPDACSIASLPALLAISARRSGVMLSPPFRPLASHLSGGAGQALTLIFDLASGDLADHDCQVDGVAWARLSVRSPKHCCAQAFGR